MNAHARTRSTDAQYIRATKTARHARAVAGLEARFLARHALCVSALRLGAARLYESRAPRIGATAATACSLPAATGARRVAVRRLLLMLLPRRAVVPARGGTQLEGVGDRRAGSLSPRQTPLRVSAAAAASPRERGDVLASALRQQQGANGALAAAGLGEGAPLSRKRKHAKNVGERCSGDWRRAGVREREPRISAGDLAVLVCGAAGRGGGGRERSRH